MKNNILKCTISVMSMRSPTTGANVHFHVAAPGWPITKLNYSTTKVGPALDASKTRMQHLDFATTAGLQLLTQKPLMLPNRLQEILRRGLCIFPQDWYRAALRAETGISTNQRQRHFVAFAAYDLQSQALRIKASKSAT